MRARGGGSWRRDCQRGLTFEFDQQLPAHDEEELVAIVVLVPVILAFDDSDSDHRSVDLSQGLIESARIALGDNLVDVDQVHVLVPDVHPLVVSIVLRHDLSRSVESTLPGQAYQGPSRVTFTKASPSDR